MRVAHPVFAALQPWLAGATGIPTLGRLNAAVAACAVPPRTDLGAIIHFVAPAAALPAAEYETGILHNGAVPTRSGNRHDAFNALCWIAFPEFKRACNALHAADVARAPAADGAVRGPARDVLTLLDESGVLVLCGDRSLADLLHGRRWRELFWDRRTEVVRALRFFVCGHALYEKLLAPYPAITARALIVSAPPALFEQDLATQRSHADAAAARAVRGGLSVTQIPPLPLAGIPGWDPGNAAPGFYDNRHVFRPLQPATAAGNPTTSAHSAWAPAPASSSEDP